MREVLVALSVAAVIAALPASAGAGECSYVSSFDLGSVTFDEGLTAARMTWAGGGAPETCEIEIGDDAGNSLTCPSGVTGNFSFASRDLGGADRDLWVFQDQVWYRRCD